MNKKDVYQQIRDFKAKYPWTIAWRLNKHCKIVEEHLTDGEVVLYAFPGQKNNLF